MVTDSLTEALRAALTACGLDAPAEIHLERPARREHGDWSSNVALVTAKAAGRNPRELAADLVAALEADPAPHVVKVEIAGPGFVNFHLDEGWLHDVLTQVVTEGADGYARPDLGGGKKVMVEFVSANPTGPLHAGHARGAVYGDSLARLLERTGHDVSREFYVNDRGVQIQHFADSLVARKAGNEPTDDGYQGAYITEWAAEMPDDADPLEWGLARARQDQVDTLAAPRHHLRRLVLRAVAGGDGGHRADAGRPAGAKGVAYEARTGPPGCGPPTTATTRTGSSSSPTASTRTCCPTSPTTGTSSPGASSCSSTCGAPTTTATSRGSRPRCQALGHDPDELEIVITQLVNLLKDGQAGPAVEADGPARHHRRDRGRGRAGQRPDHLPAAVDGQPADRRPGRGRQPGHGEPGLLRPVRPRPDPVSIGRKVAELGIERAPLADVDLGLLTHDRELELLRSLSELPEVVAGATLGRAPAPGHHLGPGAGRAVPRLLPRLLRGGRQRRSGPDPGPAVAGRGRAQVGLAIGLDLLGASAPDEM